VGERERVIRLRTSNNGPPSNSIVPELRDRAIHEQIAGITYETDRGQTALGIF
jgi:hypothetical protein